MIPGLEVLRAIAFIYDLSLADFLVKHSRAIE